MSKRYDFCIIGGGIVGLATGAALLKSRLGKRLLLLEKESRLAAHQTERNSGVIHLGIYYKPGSLEAELARVGNAAMVKFCRTAPWLMIFSCKPMTMRYMSSMSHRLPLPQLLISARLSHLKLGVRASIQAASQRTANVAASDLFFSGEAV